MLQMLRPYLEAGRKFVVVEPSVLAMFRFDLRAPRCRTRRCSRPCAATASSPCSWFGRRRSSLDSILPRCFRRKPGRTGTKLFYHSHCQQRTCNAATETIDVLRACGFDVVTSSVECCGMAGSFGYKSDYYDLSMAVGEDLFAQVREAEADRRPHALW